MRLFYAIQPEEETRDVLMELSRACRIRVGAGNWSGRDNLHITLEFLGELPEEEGLLEVMDKVTGAPFALEFGRLGFFGDPRTATLWLDVKPAAELLQLQKKLHARLGREGYRLEHRHYHPHITLARKVDLRGKDLPQVPEGRMWVTGYSLMETVRNGGKLTYRERGWRTLEGTL